MSLTKWFKEDWRDVKTGKKCGRSGKEKKTGPKAVKWSVTASGKRRKKAATGGKIHRGRKAEMA